MIYLDYSATTMVDERVLDYYVKVSKEYIGNVNSLHQLGVKSKELETACTLKIAKILGIKASEVIYTSGSSESNNTAIKGICLKYQNRGKHIITTHLEHSSIIAPLNYLTDLGFDVDFVNLTKEGTVDLDHLKSLMRDDTILVTVAAVDSELGIRQPVEEIGKIVKEYPKCYFHVDLTQAIGKIKVDLKNIDLASLSAHKFFGIKGIGLLIKKEKIQIEPLIHGGKSTTVYRSGTPVLPLIASLAKALELVYQDFDEHFDYVKELNKLIVDKLKGYDNVLINSMENSIPYTINFSLKKIKSETFVHALDMKEIYISTKSACSKPNEISNSIMAVTGSKERAASTLRISISYKTTREEVFKFLEEFENSYQKLIKIIK